MLERTSTSPFRKALYRFLGGVMVSLGILGIFLPVLPTTPFLLAAAWFFANGSPRALEWLLRNRILGAYIRGYREGKGIPNRIKVAALVFLWGTILTTSFIVLDSWPVRGLLLIIACAVTLHLWRLPTARRETPQPGESPGGRL